jgi:hypothetical protein
MSEGCIQEQEENAVQDKKAFSSASGNKRTFQIRSNDVQ